MSITEKICFSEHLFWNTYHMISLSDMTVKKDALSLYISSLKKIYSIHNKKSGKKRSPKSNQAKMKNADCSWEIMKSVTSLTPLSTGFSGI